MARGAKVRSKVASPATDRGSVGLVAPLLGPPYGTGIGFLTGSTRGTAALGCGFCGYIDVFSRVFTPEGGRATITRNQF